MRNIRNRRFMAAALLFVMSVALLGPIGGVEAAVHEVRGFTSHVDENGDRWEFFDFDVLQDSRVTATLTWDDPTADLKLYMRPIDGVLAAISTPSAAAPKTVSQFATAGSWRVMVRAQSGASDFQIDMDITSSPAPAAEVFSGSVTAGSPKVTHTFTTAEDGRIDAALIWADPANELKVVLKNAAGQTLAATRRGMSPEMLSYIGAAGDYRMEVSATTGSADYQLKLATSTQTSGSVNFTGGPKTGVLLVDAVAGERLTFDLSWVGSSSLFLLVKDPSGATVASSIGTPQPKTVTHVAADTGTYRVVAVAKSGGATDYRIDHYVTPALGSSTEVFSDVVTDAAPRKVFTFDAEAGDRLTVDLDWAEAGSDLNVFIGRPGSGLVAWSAKADKPETTSFIADASGEWRVHVVTRSGTGTFNANLSVENLTGATTAPPPPPPSGDWPQFMRDNEHTGAGDDTTITASNVAGLAPRWQANTGNNSFSSPAVAYSETLDRTLVYVGSQGGNFAAYDAETGEPIWNYVVNRAVPSSPAVVDGVVYVGSADRNLHVIDAATGAGICTFPAQGVVTSSPVVFDPDGDGPLGKLVYFGENGPTGSNDGGSFWAINAVDPDNPAQNCTQAWHFEGFGDPVGSQPEAGVWSSPAVAFNKDGIPTVVFGSSSPEGAVYALNGITGDLLWRYQTELFLQDDDVGAGATISPPGVNGFVDGIAYISGKNRIVHALNLTTGVLEWEFRIRDDYPNAGGYTRSTAALLGDRLYVGFGKGLYALDAVTGAKVWRSDTVGPDTAEILASPSITGPEGDRVIFAGDLAGNFMAFSLATGEQLWNYQTALFLNSSAAIVDGVVYVSSGDSFLYAFDLSGQVTDRPDTVITSPADDPGQVPSNPIENPAGELSLTGTASDDTSVAEVRVALRDVKRNKWWHNPTQQWRKAFSQWNADLDQAGAATSGWSASTPIPDGGGTFFLQAESVDSDGQHDPVVAKVQFGVRPQGDPPENTTIISPEFRNVFTFPDDIRQKFTVTVTGTAMDEVGDNPGVARVQVYVRNKEHQEYFCGTDCTNNVGGEDAAWQPGFKFLDATLSEVGGTNVTWTYSFQVYDHPHNYRIEAQAIDNDGHVEPFRAIVDRICVNDVGDVTCS